jgi:lysophospholipase L1-like esterase
MAWAALGVLALVCQSCAAHGDDEKTYRDYVAIGDSFTAGAGILPSDNTGCFRSSRNYPNQLAEKLHAHLRDASCGGATVAELERPQPTVAKTNPPQLDAVDHHTDLVTISLGLNDTGYGVLLQRCPQLAPTDPEGSPCRASFQTDQGDSFLSAVPGFEARLVHGIGLVRDAAPDARVVVVGFPQIAPTDGTCPELPFAAGDYDYLAEYLEDLNDVMKDAADEADADFVDVLSASRGHDICAGDDAWVLGAPLSHRTMSWHPFDNEQRAVAALIDDALH